MKKSVTLFSLTYLLLYLGLTIPGAAAEKLKMEFKCPVGKKLIWEMSSKAKEGESQMPAGLPMAAEEQTHRFGMAYLKKTADGGCVAESEQLTQPQGGMPAQMEAMAKDNPQMAAMLEKMKESMKAAAQAKHRYHFDASGKVQKVETLGGEQAANPMLGAKMQKPVPPGSGFSEMFQKAGLDKPLKVGEKRKINIDTPGEDNRLIGRIHFVKWEKHMGRKCALLNFQGEIKSKVKGKAGPHVREMKIKSTSWYDPNLGTAVDHQTEMDMTMKMDSKDDKKVMRQVRESRMKLVKIEALP